MKITITIEDTEDGQIMIAETCNHYLTGTLAPYLCPIHRNLAVH